MEPELKTHLEGMEQRIDARLNAADQKFETVNRRLTRLESMEHRIKTEIISAVETKIDEKVDALVITTAKILTTMESNHQEVMGKINARVTDLEDRSLMHERHIHNTEQDIILLKTQIAA